MLVRAVVVVVACNMKRAKHGMKRSRRERWVCSGPRTTKGVSRFPRIIAVCVGCGGLAAFVPANAAASAVALANAAASAVTLANAAASAFVLAIVDAALRNRRDSTVVDGG